MKYKLFSLFMATVMATGFSVNAFAYYKDPYATSIGVKYGKHGNYIDTTDDAELFSDDMETIGFQPLCKTSITYSDWNKKWKLVNGELVESRQGKKLFDSDVIFIAGHGSPDGIFLHELDKFGEYATGLASGNDRIMRFTDTSTG